MTALVDRCARDILAEAHRVCGFSESEATRHIDDAFLDFLRPWCNRHGCSAGVRRAGDEPRYVRPSARVERAAKTLRLASRGATGAGKSTAVARWIATRGGVEVAFAEPLYHLLHWAQWRIGAPRSKQRDFLQYAGTEWGRAIDDGIWISIARARVEENGASNVYVSDARFPNELEALAAWDFTVVKLVAPARCSVAAVGSGTLAHASETSLDNAPARVRIYNGHVSFERFHALLDAFVAEFESDAWSSAPRFYGLEDAGGEMCD